MDLIPFQLAIKFRFFPILERATPLSVSILKRRSDERPERTSRMESGSIQSALRQIRTLYSLGTLGGLSDAQLLELFLARNGDDAEAAFAALVAAPRADGPGRLSSDAAGLARLRGRLPGDVPRPGASGRVDRPARATGELALWRRRPDGERSQATSRAATRRGKAADGCVQG